MREGVLQAGLLLVLLAIAFPGFFLHGEQLSPADLLFLSKPWSEYRPADWTGPANKLMPDVITAFYPYYALTQLEIENGRWPLWNQYELGGIPLMANAQTAVFYPPRLLHTLFDVSIATSLYILLKLWLCGMSAYLCGRGIGFGPWSARAMSVAWMLCGYNICWAYWSLPDVAVWLPILFLGVEDMLRGAYRRGCIVAAIGAASMLLAGHPETAFTSAFGVGVYFLIRMAASLSRPRHVRNAVYTAAAAWAIALAVSAVQVLPLIEYIQNSLTYAQRSRAVVEPALPPSALVSFWVPRFYGTVADGTYWGAGTLNSNVYMMLYFGLPLWLAVPLGKFPLRRVHDATRVWALAGAAVLGLLLAFHLEELRFINEIPPLSSTVKFYHTVFPCFALIVLGARGLDQWIGSPRRARALTWILIPTVFAAVYTAAVWMFELPILRLVGHQAHVTSAVVSSGVIAILALAVFAFSCADARGCVFPALFIALLAADLLYAMRGLNPTMRRADIFPDTELTRYLQSLPRPCRIGAGEGGIVSGVLAPYQIEDWLGYDGLYPARVKTFQHELGEFVWEAAEPLYSNAYYLHDPGHPPLFPLDEPGRFERVAEHDGIEVYRNINALPRARLVASLKGFEDTKTLITEMSKPDFNPSTTAYVLKSDLPRNVPPLNAGDDPGTADITQYNSLRVSIDVTANTNAVLVLSDAYYPGWIALLDGFPVMQFPVYHAFRGIFVPKGKHTVEFVYAPATFQAGLAISAATLLALAILALPRLIRARSH
ncbi:MAG: hypothetical protein AMXMBFR4_20010 [Candidatus Hydrogenedentota bacterium]